MNKSQPTNQPVNQSTIWIICPFATPTKYGWRSRPYVIGKELVNRGYKVLIFSFTGNHYLRTGGYENIQPNTWENHEGVWFYWLKGIRKWRTHPLIRIINWWLFNRECLKFLKRQEGREFPQTVIFSSPPITLASLILPLKKKFNPKIIFEVRDIWPMSLVELGGMSLKNPVIQWLNRLEKRAYSQADQIVGVIPGIKNYLETYFHEHVHKAVYIPRSFEAKMHENASTSECQFDICYAGTLSHANDLMTLILALKILHQKGVTPQVLIVGTGPMENKIRKEISQLDNVRFINQWFGGEEVKRSLQQCRVCFSGLKDLKIYDYGIAPVKWIDYWMLKKTILTCYSGKVFDYAIQNFGWQVPAENPEKLASAIEEIMIAPNGKLRALGEKGYEFLLRHHAPEKIGDAYEAVIQN